MAEWRAGNRSLHSSLRGAMTPCGRSPIQCESLRIHKHSDTHYSLVATCVRLPTCRNAGSPPRASAPRVLFALTASKPVTGQDSRRSRLVSRATTTGLQFAIGWWFRKSAVFFLPPGWFGPLTWWLALPFAPAGSVSCGVWQMACKRVIKVGERVAKDLTAGEHWRNPWIL